MSIIYSNKENVHGNNNINIENWRMLLQNTENNCVLLVSENFRSYIIYDVTIRKILESNRLDIPLTKNVGYKGNYLSCKKCHGSGITDWVTEIIGKKYQYDNPSFKSDSKIALRFPENQRLIMFDYVEVEFGYIATAAIPPAMKHCEECEGTGLFIGTLLLEKFNKLEKTTLPFFS